LYSDAIAVQPNKLWSRFRASGLRLPLRLDGVKNSGDYLRALFGIAATAGVDGGSSLFGTLRSDPAFAPTDAWIIESHAALHDLVQKEPADARTPTGLSYERLLPYRDVLMRALFSKSRAASGVRRHSQRTHAA
jgi:hypothetical protein